MVSEKLFQTFLTNIEPSKTTKEMISSIQQNLRNYLANHNEYKYVYADSFLPPVYLKDITDNSRLTFLINAVSCITPVL